MNIRDILSDLGIDYAESGSHRHVTAGWVGIDCDCTPGTQKYKRGIHLAHGYTSCWSCGYLSLADALVSASGEPWNRVKALVGGFDSERFERKDDVRGTLEIPSGVGPLLPAHKRYLRGRGFDPDHLEKFWGVRGIGLASDLAWRLWIPRVRNGKTVSWTTRAIDDSVYRRYVSAEKEQEALSPKRMLFGLDHCRHACVVLEGELDAIRVGPGAVATMGVGYSRAQTVLISRFPVRVIAFDSELEAQERAKRLAESLAAFPGRTTRIELSTAKDAAAATEKEIKRLRRCFLE